jgi:Ca2+-binding EF-hand superfamily protein
MMLASNHARIATLAVCVALATIAFGPSSAHAADTAKSPSNFEDFFKMHAMPAMHMMDTDNKGYVTKEEFMKFMEDLFNRMDKDHTGKVTVEEWLGHKPGKKDEAKAKPGEKKEGAAK